MLDIESATSDGIIAKDPNRNTSFGVEALHRPGTHNYVAKADITVNALDKGGALLEGIGVKQGQYLPQYAIGVKR